jgi:hypothetical protein
LLAQSQFTFEGACRFRINAEVRPPNVRYTESNSAGRKSTTETALTFKVMHLIDSFIADSRPSI